MSCDAPLFEMQDISFVDNDFVVIHNLSLQIQKGTITAFLGEAGGGKSSALKLLAGVIPPTTGELFFEGKDVHRMKRVETLAYRKRTGFMFLDSALWQNQNIYQNL